MKRGIGSKKSKKAQFYIIAAVIIISVLIGILALRNYAKTERGETKIYDLSKELGIETGNVYDYGVYKGTNMDKLILAWAKEYSKYSQGQQVENWIFVYGNETEITPITFSTVSSGSISMVTKSGKFGVNIEKGVVIRGNKTIGTGGLVNVTFSPENFTYEFELERGKNFFFVIRSGEYSTTA